MLDAIYQNGKIYTLRKEGECFSAIGIKDGKIAFVGDAEEAKRYEAAQIFDLNGRTMIPGMGDSHLHFYAYCQTLTQVNLADCKSKKEAFAKLKEKAEHTPQGEWIRGANFDQTKWEDSADELPTRWELDEISRQHPIVIKRVCLHTAVANSMALELAGVDENYSADAGGSVEREADGAPNGVLREQLTKVFDEIAPDALRDENLKKQFMVRELQRMASRGMTMMHTYAAEIWRYIEDIDVYRQLDACGLLPVRVTIYSDRMEGLKRDAAKGAGGNDLQLKVKMGGYKLFCDGSLGSRSAALLQPYTDAPDTKGMIVEDAKSLTEKMYTAAQNGIQSAVHAIGDRALDVVLSAMEETIRQLKSAGWTNEEIAKKPFRLIHAQMSTPELIQRMKKIPLIVDIQPSFLESDRYWILDRIGPKRFRHAYPWKTYQKEGLILTGGSDCPVEDFDPLRGIYNCLTHPNPAERLSIYEAVCLFSKNIPHATGDEKRMGTIEVGKLADAAILDKDIFHVPTDEILKIRVEKTLLAGKETWNCMEYQDSCRKKEKPRRKGEKL